MLVFRCRFYTFAQKTFRTSVPNATKDRTIIHNSQQGSSKITSSGVIFSEYSTKFNSSSKSETLDLKLSQSVRTNRDNSVLECLNFAISLSTNSASAMVNSALHPNCTTHKSFFFFFFFKV